MAWRWFAGARGWRAATDAEGQEGDYGAAGSLVAFVGFGTGSWPPPTARRLIAERMNQIDAGARRRLSHLDKMRKGGY